MTVGCHATTRQCTAAKGCTAVRHAAFDYLDQEYNQGLYFKLSQAIHEMVCLTAF